MLVTTDSRRADPVVALLVPLPDGATGLWPASTDDATVVDGLPDEVGVTWRPCDTRGRVSHDDAAGGAAAPAAARVVRSGRHYEAMRSAAPRRRARAAALVVTGRPAPSSPGTSP